MSQPSNPIAGGPAKVKLTSRPRRDDDLPFIEALHAEMDAERLLVDEAGFDEKVTQDLLKTQSKARDAGHENADWDKKECVIEFNDDLVGSMVVYQDKEEIRLADLIISRSHRGLGVGYAIMSSIQQEAAASNRVLRLHVDKTNTDAIRFYEQSGFRLLEDRGRYWFVEWTPPDMTGKRLYFPGQ